MGRRPRAPKAERRSRSRDAATALVDAATEERARRTLSPAAYQRALGKS